MESLIEVRAIVRREMLERVVHALRDAHVPRLTVTRVHAVGSGVDPAAARVALDEGTEYADKALVQFVCAAERADELTQCVTDAARTGRPGDGIVYAVPVTALRKIRTGVAGLAALD